MIRDGLAADAACVLVSVFPSGEVQLAHRSRPATTMIGEPGLSGILNGTRLRMEWANGVVTARLKRKDGAWQTVGKTEFRSENARAGVIALSHDPIQLTVARYRDLRVTDVPIGEAWELSTRR
jgi:hypothetical protein